MIFDAASEGTHVILGMLVVGLIFLAVILLGELVRWAGHRRAERRRAPPAVLSRCAAARDLREWIALLEREGELVRVRPRSTRTSR